jgi:hemerythrin
MQKVGEPEQNAVASLCWREEYSLGIPEIDDQHKELIKRFAAVEVAIATRQGWSELHFAILGILRYAEFHFQFEEALMRLYGFPQIERHMLEHRQILQAAETFIDESLRNVALVDIALFYQDWLAAHIQGEDRLYAEYILAGNSIVTCQSRQDDGLHADL